MTGSQLKSLQTQLRDAQNEELLKKASMQVAQREFNEARKKAAEIQRKIETLTSEGLVVSEHALLRYLERIVGIDTEAVRDKILSPELKRLHLELGDGKFPLAEPGARAVIKGNVIVTIED